MRLTPLADWVRSEIRRGSFLGLGLRKAVLGLSEWRGLPRILGEFPQYRRWMRDHDLTPDQRAKDTASWEGHPTPTVTAVIPTYQPDLSQLAETLASLKGQTYPAWNAVIVDDGTGSSETSAWLARQARSDPRIRIVSLPENGGIARATNAGIAAADGDVIAFVDHDDLLAPEAFSAVMRTFVADPACQCAFTDEDKLDHRGQRCEPYFKPGFNRALLYARNYVNHLTMVRRAAIVEVGEIDPRLDGAQDYDLVLRILAKWGDSAIRHIPVLAYSWRRPGLRSSFSTAEPDRAWEAGRVSLEAHLSEMGVRLAGIERAYGAGWRLRFPAVEKSERIAVIIPTRDRVDLMEACLASLEGATDVSNLDLIIVDNESVEPATREWFKRLPKRFPYVQVLKVSGEFNYSRLMNLGVKASTASRLLLLNNDVVDGQGDWITEMAGWADMAWVGCVGARLLYPDGTLQHGGVITGPGAAAGHYERHARPDDVGAFGHLRLPRCCAAVTAACLMVRRTVFESVGGFNEIDFPVAFSDVDFCLRVRAAGYENVWTPYACLTHLEGASRGRESGESEQTGFLRARDALQQRWAAQIRQDPYSNPALDPSSERVGLKLG